MEAEEIVGERQETRSMLRLWSMYDDLRAKIIGPLNEGYIHTPRF